MTVAQRLDRRLDNKVGRAEIGLPYAKIDDVTTLRRQGVGSRKDRKGVFLADAIEGGDGAKHDCILPCGTVAGAPARRVLNEGCTSADQATKIKRRQNLHSRRAIRDRRPYAR